jgi:RNA polymerase sigma-70 factor, ECF subfamily
MRSVVPSNRQSGRDESHGFHSEALGHLDSLFRLALRKTRNRQDAADLVQDTFLRALQFQHRFQPGTDCRAWLFRIMHNLFINGLRRVSRPMVDFDERWIHREVGMAGSVGGSPDGDALRRLACRHIQHAIATLPRKFRAVVVLADLEGCSYREIAEICGCPVGTVMSRLYRARRALRAILRNHDAR